jgi:hypothetical protein
MGLSFIGVSAEAKSPKFSRDPLTFDAQAVGTSSSAIQTTLSNVDDKNPLEITKVLTGDIPGDFVLSDNQFEISLDPNRRCTFSVSFSLTALGARSGKLTVTSARLSAGVSIVRLLWSCERILRP